MEFLENVEFIKVSELQKVTSGKLRRLTKRAVLVTEHSRPRYVLLKLEDYQEKKGVEDYLYLISRPHPWKRQLFVKGRNMSVAQLVHRMRREKWQPEQAASEFSLPLETVLEALHYFHHHQKLIELENLEEKRHLEDFQKPSVS